MQTVFCVQKIALVVVMAGEAYNVEKLKASGSKRVTCLYFSLAFSYGRISVIANLVTLVLVLVLGVVLALVLQRGKWGREKGFFSI